MSGRTFLTIFAVLILTVSGVVFVLVSVAGPSIFNPFQASSSVSAAPENNNSGILSTPTVAVVPTETLVPTVVETPKPLPTETPVRPTETKIPSPTPTAVATVDPDKVWPEFPRGTPELTGRYMVVIDPISKTHFASGSHFDYVRRIEEYEGGFKVYGMHSGDVLVIKVTGSDEDWIYVEVNSIKFKMRPGTLTFITSKTVPGAALPFGVGERAIVLFDPVEQKFQAVNEKGESLAVTATYYIVLRGGDAIDIGYYLLEGYTREGFCEAVYDQFAENWKWGDSSIVHDPRVEGCPYVGVIQ